jgi:ubiquinone/menaquinone biosynthesis C-methylase UbiE
VLEHCDDYSAIVDEFHRVLCPGGLLALTFDISLDGRWEIPRAKAEDLLRDVTRRFASEDGTDLLRRLESGPVESILSTYYAQKNDPGSLPWGILSDLKSLAKLRLPGRPHKALTCCSIAVLRKDR